LTLVQEHPHKPEVVADDNNLCGEAPVWDAARGRLLWGDLSSNLVYELDPAAGRRAVISRELNARGIAIDRGGALVFGPARWFLNTPARR
jgi:sugar lactone lactonase YvrE